MSSFLQEIVILGRNLPGQIPLATVSIDDDYVSNRHARVDMWSGGRMYITDLGSTNGTWVNDQKVLITRELVSGDRLRLGHSEVTMP